MDNMPVLYKNIMDGLPSRFAKDAFLWATEQPENDCMCYNAEKFAREVHNLVDFTKPIFDFAFEQHRAVGQSVKDDLQSFMLTRQANWCYGGNKKPRYVGEV